MHSWVTGGSCDAGWVALQNFYVHPVWDTKDNGKHLLMTRQGRDYMTGIWLKARKSKKSFSDLGVPWAVELHYPGMQSQLCLLWGCDLERVPVHTTPPSHLLAAFPSVLAYPPTLCLRSVLPSVLSIHPPSVHILWSWGKLDQGQSDSLSNQPSKH